MNFKIEAKNFLCYEELNLDFSNLGLTLIESENRDEALLSSNGGGKSSVIEALCWGIYGKSTKTSDQDKLVHNYKNGGKDCEVITHFGDLRIERYRKHSKQKNDLLLFEKIDNKFEEITKKSVKDTQAEIERKLGLSYESFRHAIYFSQNNLTKFSTATDSEQKSIIEDILGLKTLSSAQVWCKEKTTEFEKIIDKNTNELNSKENYISEQRRRVSSLYQKSDSFDKNKSAKIYLLESELSILKKELENLQLIEIKLDDEFDKDKAELLIKSTEDKKTIVQTSQNKIKEINNSINSFNNSINANYNNISVIKKKIDDYNKKINEINLSINNNKNKESNILSKISELEFSIEHYSAPTVNCKECGQPVTVESAKVKIDLMNDEIDKHKSSLDSLQDIYNNYFLTIENIKTKIELEENNIKFIKSEIEKMEDIIPSLRDKISVEESIISSNSNLLELANKLRLKIQEEESKKVQIQMNLQKIDFKNKSIEQKLIDIQNANNIINPYTEQIREELSIIENLNAELEIINNTLREIKEEKKYYDYWVNGFSNSRLKSYIMESITPTLNERANYFSKFLTSGSYAIEISTQTKLKNGEIRDKFSVNVDSPSGSDYEMCSGGEKKRIDLCILLALQELTASRSNVPLDLLILDEFSESLDDVGAERMIQLLKEIGKTKETILYITHNSEMKYLFQSTIKIVKENNTSRLLN